MLELNLESSPINLPGEWQYLRMSFYIKLTNFCPVRQLCSLMHDTVSLGPMKQSKKIKKLIKNLRN